MAGTILVVEDNAITRKMMRVALATEGYEVIEAPDGRTALELVARHVPDLIFQDLLLPDVDGFQLVVQLRSLLAGHDVPIVACSGFLSRIETAQTMALGFTDFLVKPVEPSRLLEVARIYLRPADQPGPLPGRGRRILLVDDDRLQLKLQRMHLLTAGFEVDTAGDGAEALEAARRHPPDAILSDILMPRVDGFRLCVAIRGDPALRGIPVVLVSSNYIEEQDRRLAERAGADAMIFRTPDGHDSVTALLSAIDRPRTPASPAQMEELEPWWMHRVTRQLERQAGLNTGLLQRASIQAAILAMLGGLADVLAGSSDVGAPSEVLATVLDVGGVSAGVIYLVGADGQLRLQTESGFGPGARREQAGDFFGHPELFDQALEIREPLSLVDEAEAPAAVRDLLQRAAVSSALIVAIRSHGERLGVLLLASVQRDFGQRDWLVFAQSMAGQIGQTIALNRAFVELTASERRYRTLVHNVPVGLFTTTPDGRILEVNPAAIEVLGYRDREQVLATNVADTYADPEDRARAVAIAHRDGSVRGFETQLRRGDGKTIWVSLNFRVTQADGQTTYEGSFESIADRKLAEQQLEEQQSVMAQTEKLAAMGQLLAGVAHEVNNPLSVVLGQARLLETDAKGSPLAERARKVSKAADRCARIVKNFLALARQQPPERRVVQLNAVVTDAVELLGYPLRVDSVEVTLDLDQDLPTFWADPNQLHQVALNLVTNAHQAMRESTAPRRLTITTRSEGERCVVLTVADSGPGVPPAIRERVLEPFFTTKPAGQGTGLGLSLCHGIVEEHGGTIAIDDAPGGGARFRIELPVKEPSHAASPAPTATEPAGPAGLHILVVDDEVDVAELLQEVLESHGHHVATARNGQVALERLAERPFDLILSDVKMPVLDGPAFYRELERHHPGMERRILFMTGDSLSVDVRQFLERSGMPILAKPFAPADVLRTINRAAALAAAHTA